MSSVGENINMAIRRKELLVFITVFVLTVLPFWKILISQGLPAYAYFYLHPGYGSYFTMIRYGYGYSFALGGSTFIGWINIPTYCMLEFVYRLVNSFEVTFKLFILLIFLIFAFTTYFIFRFWLNFSPLVTIISTMLVVYFPYTIMYASILEVTNFFYISWSLLLLLCSIKFINNKNYMILPLIVAFSFLSSGKPQYFAFFSMAIFLYWFLICLSITEKSRLFEHFASLLIIGLSMLAGSLHLILPYVFNPTSEWLVLALESAHETIKYVSQFTSPVYSLVLSNKVYPNLSGSYASSKLYKFVYSETLIFYLIVVIGLLALVVPKNTSNENEKRNILFLAILYIFGVLWYNGSNPPIPIAYYLVHWWPFSILRSTIHVWVLVAISLASLVGYFLRFIKIRNLYIYKIFTIVLLFLLFTRVVFPISLDGTFFGTSSNIQLPKEYEEVVDYFHNKLNNEFFRVFIPKTHSLIHYSWAVNNAYENNIFTAYWIPNLHLLGTIKTPPVSVVSSYFDGQLGDDYSKVIPTLLGIMNIKYVILDKNIIEIKNDIGVISKKASNSLGPPVKSFGNIIIYENPNFLPLVYVPSQVILVNSSSEQAFTQAALSITRSKVVFVDNITFNELKPYLEFEEEVGYFKSSPNLEVLNVEGDKVKLQVYNVTGPFLLVLSSNYDKLLEINSPSIEVATHYKVNSFANAWLVMPKVNAKEILVEVKYGGVSDLITSFLFSLFSPFILLIFVSIKNKLRIGC